MPLSRQLVNSTTLSADGAAGSSAAGVFGAATEVCGGAVWCCCVVVETGTLAALSSVPAGPLLAEGAAEVVAGSAAAEGTGGVE